MVLFQIEHGLSVRVHPNQMARLKFLVNQCKMHQDTCSHRPGSANSRRQALTLPIPARNAPAIPLTNALPQANIPTKRVQIHMGTAAARLPYAGQALLNSSCSSPAHLDGQSD